jgi:hypothetical protein
MTAALLDRLTHRCAIFEMNGESYRFRESMKNKKKKGGEPRLPSLWRFSRIAFTPDLGPPGGPEKGKNAWGKEQIQRESCERCATREKAGKVEQERSSKRSSGCVGPYAI